jgi:hypothetical protein
MPDIQVSWLAVLASVVLGFFLSFIWYTPLFGKAWNREMGMDPNLPVAGAELAKSLVMTAFSVFLIAFVLAHNIAAWTPSTWGSNVPGLAKPEHALQAAGFTWLGFFVPKLLMGVAWEKRSWKLFWIDAGYYLVLLTLCAFILLYL